VFKVEFTSTGICSVWFIHTSEAHKHGALTVTGNSVTIKNLAKIAKHLSASDSVVFLRHCTLYKFTYLLTYLLT